MVFNPSNLECSEVSLDLSYLFVSSHYVVSVHLELDISAMTRVSSDKVRRKTFSRENYAGT